MVINYIVIIERAKNVEKIITWETKIKHLGNFYTG